MENNINIKNIQEEEKKEVIFTEKIEVQKNENDSLENKATHKKRGRPSKKQDKVLLEENNKSNLQKESNGTFEEQSIEWYTCDIKDFIGKIPLKNFQSDRRGNIELYKHIASNVDSIVPFLLKTMGFNYKNIPIISSLILTTRLAPVTVKKLLVIEASGPATAKTSTLSFLGDENYALISEEPSKADITGNKKFKIQTGLIRKSIIQIDEAGNMTIPEELIGIIKSITSQEEYSKTGEDKIEIELSIIFTGNPSKEYFNRDEKTLNIDYCIKNLKELSLSLVKNFDYALLDRAIVTPGFLLTPIESYHLLQEDEEIPKVPFKINAPEEIKIFEDYTLNVHTLWNTYINFRSEELLSISSEVKNKAKDTTARSIKAVNTLYTAFKRMYDPKNIYSKEKDLGLQELAMTYRNYANGYYQPLDKGYIRYLLVDIAKMIIEKEDIEEIYFYENRIFLKPNKEKKFYKVALNLEGQKENIIEHEYYNSCSENIKSLLAEIFSLKYHGNVLIQEYYRPFSSSKALVSKAESKLEKEIRKLEKKYFELKIKSEQFEKNVYTAFEKLIEQIKYNSKNMLEINRLSFYEEEILEALSVQPNKLSFGLSLKNELAKYFSSPDNIANSIEKYDISLSNGLKFINFHNLDLEYLEYLE